MAEFNPMSGPHNALLRAATTAYRKLVPKKAARAYAADLRETGRDADAEVLEAYADTPEPKIETLEEKRQRLAEANAEIKELRAELGRREVMAWVAQSKLKAKRAARDRAVREARADAERIIAEPAETEAEPTETEAKPADGLTPTQRALFRPPPILRKRYGL